MIWVYRSSLSHHQKLASYFHRYHGFIEFWLSLIWLIKWNILAIFQLLNTSNSFFSCSYSWKEKWMTILMMWLMVVNGVVLRSTYYFESWGKWKEVVWSLCVVCICNLLDLSMEMKETTTKEEKMEEKVTSSSSSSWSWIISGGCYLLKLATNQVSELVS